VITFVDWKVGWICTEASFRTKVHFEVCSWLQNERVYLTWLKLSSSILPYCIQPTIFWHFCWQVRLLYKGTLRVLLVLLHDFPEFLCDHHFTFCDVIPPSCIQMRNLILSAFPRNMRLPDPFTPNLKVSQVYFMLKSCILLKLLQSFNSGTYTYIAR
jgi:hypothetical protein